LVVTHIYLLIGCAMPVTLSFIIFNGGLLTPEFTVIAFSGVVFLGVGDVVACVYGKLRGKSLVRVGSKKTVEGSYACWAAMTVAFAGVVAYCCPFAANYFFIFFVTSMLTSIVEAYTL
jgi:dolichol kinase